MPPTSRLGVLIVCVAFLASGVRSQQGRPPSHSFDLIHVSLDLTVNYANRTFQGTVINTVLPSENVDVIALHCGRNLAVQSCQVDGRTAICQQRDDRREGSPTGGFVRASKAAVGVRYSDPNQASSSRLRWIRPT